MKRITAQLFASQCYSESLSPKNEHFHFYLQRVIGSAPNTKLIVGSVSDLFAAPNNAACGIKEWYLSATSSAVKLEDSDQIAIRMNQIGRTNPLELLTTFVQVSTQKAAEAKLSFRIQVYLETIDEHFWTLNP